MESQTTPESPATETTAEETATVRRRQSALDGIDVKPIRLRLNRMVGTPWEEAHRKINAFLRTCTPLNRAAYARYVGSAVETGERVLPDSTFYVGEYLTRDKDGKAIGTVPDCLVRRSDPPSATPAEPSAHPDEVLEFLSDRVVGERGSSLFWFNPTQRTVRKFSGVDPATNEPYFYLRQKASYRQGVALTPEETAAFNGFDEAVRKDILAKAPASDSFAN